MSDAADDLSSKYVIQTVGFDARFPNTNQTRNCFQNYTDYFKCVAAKGDGYAPCKQFKKAYNSLCPSALPPPFIPYDSKMIEPPSFARKDEWIGKWDDQRESGSFPASLEP